MTTWAIKTPLSNRKPITPPADNAVAEIELRGVSRRFGSHAILRDVWLSVRTGETLALIGESGCGKSVTMKLMMSLLTPTEGEVHWSGCPVGQRTRQQRRREQLRFGYLFQGAALFDSLDVFENVAFGLRQNTQLEEDAVRAIVYERIREVGLNESICTKKPAELSGGMKKRVGLARALALDPEVIFYDEPTTGLDPIMSDVINELIVMTRSRRPVTSIVVTHDMRTVQKVADRIVMLQPLSRLEPGESQIAFEGTTAEAFSSAEPHIAQFIAGDAGSRTLDGNL